MLEILEGLEGVINQTDDTVVYGATIANIISNQLHAPKSTNFCDTFGWMHRSYGLYLVRSGRIVAQEFDSTCTFPYLVSFLPFPDTSILVAKSI